jgi:FkbM family methyltransferase
MKIRNKLVIKLFNYFIKLKILNKNSKNSLFLLERILNINYKPNALFNFIQIGANDGTSFDNLHPFLLKTKPEGIAVEPITEYFDKLIVNYSAFEKVKKLKLALHSQSSEIEIFKIKKGCLAKYPDWCQGIASISINHILNFDFIDPSDVETEKVKAIKFMEIVGKELENKDLDYLQIDTEGYDFEIIKMIDFNKFKPKIIKMEFVNLDEDDKKAAKKLLEDYGYYVVLEGIDYISFDLNKINLY